MSDSFANEHIPCPHCKELPEFKDAHWSPYLECSERNYSGYSVDMANCPECGRGYQIRYSVKAVDRVSDWDCGTRLEREEHERKGRLETIKRKRIELTELVAAEEAERKGE